MGKGEKKSNPVVTGYLFLYNAACCVGWGLCLVKCIQHIRDQSIETLYTDVEMNLKIVQTAAVLEIIHAAIGFVKSPVMTTFMQVFSRVWTLWAVMHISPMSQTSLFFTLACTSWSLVEVPRYAFYAFNLLGSVPYPLFWLRYSLFAILYPTGITGELGCMYYSLVELLGEATSLQEIPVDKFGLMVLTGLVILTYIPGSPTMYKHMLKTRRKQFDELKKKETADDKKH